MRKSDRSKKNLSRYCVSQYCADQSLLRRLFWSWKRCLGGALVRTWTAIRNFYCNLSKSVSIWNRTLSGEKVILKISGTSLGYVVHPPLHLHFGEVCVLQPTGYNWSLTGYDFRGDYKLKKKKNAVKLTEAEEEAKFNLMMKEELAEYEARIGDIGRIYTSYIEKVEEVEESVLRLCDEYERIKKNGEQRDLDDIQKVAICILKQRNSLSRTILSLHRDYHTLTHPTFWFDDLLMCLVVRISADLDKENSSLGNIKSKIDRKKRKLEKSINDLEKLADDDFLSLVKDRNDEDLKIYRNNKKA